jgi:putative ABC transport system ATP-binding protein
MDTPAAVTLEQICKRYGDGQRAVAALTDVDLEVAPAELVAVMGPCGSGKSTLLNLIAGLDVPSEGQVRLFGQDMHGLSDDQRSDIRLRHIGFVFQAFHLFPTFTAEENVAWPMTFVGLSWWDARARGAALLDEVGIDAGARGRVPAELSGGEQQRVAIARALANRPRLLLADEPTGNLDARSAGTVLELLIRLNRTQGLTVILATHNQFVAARAHRILDLRDGRVTSASCGRAPKLARA